MDNDIRTIKRSIPQPIWRAARAAALLQSYKTFGSWLCDLITWAVAHQWSKDDICLKRGDKGRWVKA